MKALPFQFEWDEAKAKADANARKHGVAFELASAVYLWSDADPAANNIR